MFTSRFCRILLSALWLATIVAANRHAWGQDEGTREFRVRLGGGERDPRTSVLGWLHFATLSINSDGFSLSRKVCGSKAGTIPLEAITAYSTESRPEPHLAITIRWPAGSSRSCRVSIFGPSMIDRGGIWTPDDSNNARYVESIRELLQERIHACVTAKQAQAKEEAEREESKRNAQPAGLIISGQFDDSASTLPDNRMDAGKKAELVVAIQNQGPGPAFSVVPEISVDNPHVTVLVPGEIGDLSQGEKRNLRVPIQADLELPDGVINILLQAHEKRGYDAHEVSLQLNAAALERPSLSIASWEINDGTTGRARGNGNHIPESGETIELQVFVKNNGPGAAAAPKLSLSNIVPGIEVVQSSDTLGLIQPGHTAEGAIVFTIPRTYSGKGLNLTLQAVDGRGPAVSTVSQDVVLRFSARAPALTPAVRVLLAGQEAKELANGDTAELEVGLDNTGEMDAEDVVLNVSAAGAVFQADHVSLGALPAGGKVPLQRFKFTIPRPFSGANLPLVIALTQKDFPAATVFHAIPIRLHQPNLTAARFGIGSEGAKAIRQNEASDLELQIVNSGSLTAEGVQASIEVATPGVDIEGPRVVSIGTLPPNEQQSASFHLRTRGGAPVGDLPIQLIISQADFPARTDTIHFNITPEQPTPVIVKPGTVTAEVPNQPQKPVIVVASPRDGGYVHGSLVELVSAVVDQKGVNLIEISVNEKPVPQEAIRQGMTRHQGDPASGREETDLRVPLSLDPGQNTIKLTAYNLGNERATDIIKVNRLEDQPDKTGTQPMFIAQADVDSYVLGLTPRPSDPHLWAVLIGIEQYRKTETVPFAAHDAYAMREYALRLLGVPPEHILLLIDDKATKTELQELLKDHLPGQIRPGDTVYVYFAGHGMAAPDPGAKAATPYLLPADGNPGSLPITGYPMKEFYSDLGGLQSKRVVVFLDACFSGPPGTRSAYTWVDNPCLLYPNLVCISAAGNNQLSNPYKEGAHGLFTYFLLKGLMGEAGTKERLMLSELAKYVHDQVSSTSRQRFGESQSQTPVVNPQIDPSRDIVLREK